MPPRERHRAPLHGLLSLLWRQALFALPFALFFGTLMQPTREGYLLAFRISLVFSYAIGLALWTVEFFVLPRLPAADSKSARASLLREGLWFTGASMLGGIAAALVVHFAVLPTFLGSARSVLTIFMFLLLFGALFLAIAYTISFYRQALERVRSEEELVLARRIQRSFLLSSFPRRPRFDVHALNLSSKQVSGDFYDVVPAGDRAFLLAIADVAGKGVPAALLSSMLQASLRTQANGEPSVASILRNINALVYRSTAVHQFATFFLARVEEDTMRLSFSNAGHNHPVVFGRDGRERALERGGVVVGILEDARYEEDSIALVPGDRVVFYTDGVTEAENARGELFGEERLHALVRALPPDLASERVTERILAGVRSFLDGRDAGDDITLMVLRVLEPGAGVEAEERLAGR